MRVARYFSCSWFWLLNQPLEPSLSSSSCFVAIHTLIVRGRPWQHTHTLQWFLALWPPFCLRSHAGWRAHEHLERTSCTGVPCPQRWSSLTHTHTHTHAQRVKTKTKHKRARKVKYARMTHLSPFTHSHLVVWLCVWMWYGDSKYRLWRLGWGPRANVQRQTTQLAHNSVNSRSSLATQVLCALLAKTRATVLIWKQS